MTDSTHIIANANKNKFIRKTKIEKPKVNMEELEAAVQDDRVRAWKKELKPRKVGDSKKRTR
jgi:hypothetical protein